MRVRATVAAAIIALGAVTGRGAAGATDIEPTPPPTGNESPASEPTPAPTATAPPTSEPTPAPTATAPPTSEPTPAPTATAPPTTEPTPAPTAAESEQPGLLTPPSEPLVSTPPPGWPDPPPTTAAAFLLLVADTGQVLAERSPDELRPVASTVKMLTALTVLGRAEPDDVVEVGDEVVGVGGASTGVEAGERWTVEQLLDALIVRSGNDAAVALAVHVGGSVEGFLELMRADAAALGLDDLVLVSPSGLQDRNRLSARQLGVVARAAMADPRFREIAEQAEVALPGLGTQETRNLLLNSYPGATGIKTGYTRASGYSLVASALQDGRELIAVVLGSRGDRDRFDDAEALLDHGFETFAEQRLGLSVDLARAGDDAALRAPPVAVSVPRDDPTLTIESVVPVEIPATAATVDVHWNGHRLFELEPTVTRPERAEAEGAAALGRYLQDRVFAAMRAATVADAWPEHEGSGVATPTGLHAPAGAARAQRQDLTR